MTELFSFALKGTLPICIIAGVFGLTIWWLKFQKRLGIFWKEALVLSVAHFLMGVVVMKLWAIIEVGGDLEKAANMRLFGAMFLLPPLYYLWAKTTKRNISLAMDASVVCCLIGLVVGRINCLLSGCCKGTAVFFAPEFRWPLREIELIYCVVFAIIFGRKVLKGKTKGEGLPLFMISYGTLRFIMEWGREEYTGSIGMFHLAHIWSLIAIVVGTGLYIKNAKEHRSGEVRRKSRANTR